MESRHEQPEMTGDADTQVPRREAEWVIRQGFACVWVQAPDPRAAVESAVKRLGHMGAWKVGRDVGQEVFAADEYRNHAQPGDYTRSVIVASRSR